MSNSAGDELPDWTSYVTGENCIYMVTAVIPENASKISGISCPRLAENVYAAHTEDQQRLGNAQFRVPREKKYLSKRFIHPILKQFYTLRGKTGSDKSKPSFDSKDSLIQVDLEAGSLNSDTKPHVGRKDGEKEIVWPSRSLEMTAEVIFGLHTEIERISTKDLSESIINLYDLDSPYKMHQGYFYSCKSFEDRRSNEYHTASVANYELCISPFAQVNSVEERWNSVERARDCILTCCEGRVWDLPRCCARMSYRSSVIGNRRFFVKPFSCGALVSSWCSSLTCGFGCNGHIETMDVEDEDNAYQTDQIIHSTQFLNLGLVEQVELVTHLCKYTSVFLQYQAVIRWALRHVSIRMLQEPRVYSLVMEYQHLHKNQKIPPYLQRSILNPVLTLLPLYALKEEELKYICLSPSLLSYNEQQLLWRLRNYSSTNVITYPGTQLDLVPYADNAILQHSLPYRTAEGDKYGENMELFTDGTRLGDVHKLETLSAQTQNVTSFLRGIFALNEKNRAYRAFRTVNQDDKVNTPTEIQLDEDHMPHVVTTAQADFCRDLVYGCNASKMNAITHTSVGEVYTNYDMHNLPVFQEMMRAYTHPSLVTPVSFDVAPRSKCHWAYILFMLVFHYAAIITFQCFFANQIIQNVYNAYGYKFNDGSQFPLGFMGAFFVISPIVHIIIHAYNEYPADIRTGDNHRPELPSQHTTLEMIYNLFYNAYENVWSFQQFLFPVIFGVECLLQAVHFSELGKIPVYAFFIPLYVMLFFQLPFSWCRSENDEIDSEACFLYWLVAQPQGITAIQLHLTLSAREYSGLIVFSPLFFLVFLTIIGLIFLCCSDSNLMSTCLVLLGSMIFFLGVIFLALYWHDYWTPHNTVWAPSFPVMMVPWWILIVSGLFALLAVICSDDCYRHVDTPRVQDINRVHMSRVSYVPYMYSHE